MKGHLLHIYRNTPFGREILLQSIYFCKQTGTRLNIYLPRFRQFLMYFKGKVVTVDLDISFLRSRDAAQENAMALAVAEGIRPHFLVLQPEDHTSGSIPTLGVDFDYMCCPRTIRKLSTKVRLGFVGSKIRSIINSASFPVLIPSPVFKRWNSVTVFWGGSDIARHVLTLGARISRKTGLPLNVFTRAEKKDRQYYLDLMSRQLELENMAVQPEEPDSNVYRLIPEVEKGKPMPLLASHLKKHGRWYFFSRGKFVENLFQVPHDSLVVVGSHGHGVVKELFGSKTEIIQKILPNNLLVVGPMVGGKLYESSGTQTD